MDMFYAEKLWQKAKEEWGIEDTHPSYNKILQAFVWGVQHVPEGYAIVPIDFAGDAVNSAFRGRLEDCEKVRDELLKEISDDNEL